MTGAYLVEVALTTHDDLLGHRLEAPHDCAVVRRCGRATARITVPVLAGDDTTAVLVATQVATAHALHRQSDEGLPRIEFMPTGAQMLDFPT